MSNLKELLAQRAALDEQISQTKERERSEAVAKAKALMREYGLSVADLSMRTPRQDKVSKVAAKYRNQATGDQSKKSRAKHHAQYCLSLSPTKILCLVRFCSELRDRRSADEAEFQAKGGVLVADHEREAAERAAEVTAQNQELLEQPASPPAEEATS